MSFILVFSVSSTRYIYKSLDIGKTREQVLISILSYFLSTGGYGIDRIYVIIKILVSLCPGGIIEKEG